jgi:hypothetical protein
MQMQWRCYKENTEANIKSSCRCFVLQIIIIKGFNTGGSAFVYGTVHRARCCM